MQRDDRVFGKRAGQIERPEPKQQNDCPDQTRARAPAERNRKQRKDEQRMRKIDSRIRLVRFYCCELLEWRRLFRQHRPQADLRPARCGHVGLNPIKTREGIQ